LDKLKKVEQTAARQRLKLAELMDVGKKQQLWLLTIADNNYNQSL